MVSDLAFALAKNGHEIHIVTSRQKYNSPASELPSSEVIGNVVVHRVWTTRFGRNVLAGRAIDYLSFYVTAFVSLFMLVRKGDVVVAKTDPPLISVVVTLVCFLKGARQINWLQDLFPEVAERLGVSMPALLYCSLRWIRNVSLRHAIANVVIGEKMADLVHDNNISADSIHVITNWADSSKVWPVNHADNPLRTEWGIEDRFVVGYSGNMGRGHDFTAILDAAEKLCDRKDILFVFIGDGARRESLEREAYERGINVLFKPYQPVEKLALSLSVADIHLISLKPNLEGLIVPSKFYGIIAAARVPVFIGMEEGEIARIVRREGFGYALPENPDALKKLLTQLAAEREQTQKMGELAYNYYQEHNSLDIATSSWQRLLSPYFPIYLTGH